MTFVAFLGPFLIGAGPLIVLFCLFVARKSFVVLLTLASAVYWLTLLLTFASFLRPWTPLEHKAGTHAGIIMLAVLVEQLARVFLYKLTVQITSVLQEVGRKTGHGFNALDEVWVWFAIGFGHATTHSIFSFVSLLETTSTHATYYLESCPAISVYLGSALFSLSFAMLHLFLTMVFFQGMQLKNLSLMVIPAGVHLCAGLVTVGNFGDNGCYYTLPVVLMMGIGSCFWAIYLTWEKVKRQYPVNRNSF